MTKSLFIAAAAAVAFAGHAQAQAPAPVQAQPAPQANLRGNWLQADTTRQQAQQRAATLFQKLDTNRDGIATRQEADQAVAQLGAKGGGQGAKRGGLGGRMVERLFSNADRVTQAQFEAQALARFDRQDLNRDGTVTADERQKARAAREQRGS